MTVGREVGGKGNKERQSRFTLRRTNADESDFRGRLCSKNLLLLQQIKSKLPLSFMMCFFFAAIFNRLSAWQPHGTEFLHENLT